ncbi:MAG: NUDIX domain-containing protein [Bilifractor sp.]|jgi:8-oxo-dGTP pyrophosphatase MutT (NUDIX family)
MTGLSTLCYIEKDGKYLMLHRTKKEHDVNKDKWIGVGGHFEADESPEECILREVKEETGLTLTSWRYRGIVTFISGDGVTEYMSLFTADGFTGEISDCDEGVLEWVDKKKIWDLNLWEGDKIFFLLLEREEPFFSLKLVYDGNGRLDYAALNGKPMELFELLNEDKTRSGVVEERNVAHYLGNLHETVHMWIVRRGSDGRAQVLLQKRSQEKDSNPGCYDISSAGHMDAGDEPMEAAIREIGEELGIQASAEDLHYIGAHYGAFDDEFHGRPFHDREWSHVFIYNKPVDADRLRLQKSEIESVRWMDYDECRRRILDGTLETCIYPDEFDMVGDYIRDQIAGQPVSR